MVSGIIDNPPPNSHLQFKMLAHFDILMKRFGWGGGWWNNNYYSYILVQEGSDVKKLGAEIHEYFKKISETARTRLHLQPLKDIHLRSNYAIDLYGQSQDKSIYIYIFSVVAFIVLLIACINFMNLSTARSANRCKEVAMRKTVGANKSDVIRQFFGESLFLSMVACFFGAVLVIIFLPAFNSLTGKSLVFNFYSDIRIFLILIGIGLVTGILSGIYPAFFISSFQPVSIFRGTSVTGGRSSFFRKTLVVFQFSLSIIFIAGTLIVFHQLNYVRNKDLGFDKESIIHFRIRGNLGRNFNAFKNVLLQNSGIKNISKSSDLPTYTVHSTSGISWEGKSPTDAVLIHQFSVGYDYIKTFGMEIVDGRDFSKEFSTDAKTQSFILNETAVKHMGMESPVGKWFQLWNLKGTIVGIVKDFHFKSFHKEIEPLVLRLEPRRDSYAFVRLAAGSVNESIEAVKEAYNKFSPRYPFEFAFLDESLDSLYRSDKQTGKIFGYFTFLAIFISCLGLFGLASFMIEQRTKEIGIRKVLGANIPRIIFLISKEFIKWVVVASLLAVPVAYLAMSKWLQNFVYRTSIHPGVFFLAAAMALVIALGTVSFQSIKAALANPIDCMRYE
jgi:ABC-type antimicrobial peptide transport system permease subunit